MNAVVLLVNILLMILSLLILTVHIEKGGECMEMQMLTQDTGEFRGRVSYFVSKFIETHSQGISQLANGEKFRKSMIFVNEKACSSFEVNFVYYKLGIFKSDQLEVYINGVYVAVVKL